MRWSSEQHKAIAKDEKEESQAKHDHFEFHYFKWLLWDAQGANQYEFVP